jgi:hypothetical protein
MHTAAGTYNDDVSDGDPSRLMRTQKLPHVASF